MNDKRKRAAPTIDLTATELSSEPAPAAPGPEPVSEPAAEAAGPSAPPPQQAPARASGLGPVAAALIGGVSGAAIAAALCAALWFAGVLPGASKGAAEAKLVILEKQVHELQSRPPADTQALEALRQRLSRMEHDIAALPPGDKSVAERLASADSAMKSLGIALAALNKRSDDTAAKAAQAQASAAAAEKAVGDLRASVASAASKAANAVDPAKLEALQKQVAALEASVAAAHAQIARTTAVDGAARLALGASALLNAVESGAPYAAELAQVKALGADGKALAPLSPFAAQGLPREATLIQELDATMPALLKAAGARKPPADFLARLEDNAGKLVRIRPVNAPPGNDPSAVLARIEVDAAHGDTEAALADLDRLPAAARSPARSWIAKVKARRAALDAARRLASDTAQALGRK